MIPIFVKGQLLGVAHMTAHNTLSHLKVSGKEDPYMTLLRDAKAGLNNPEGTSQGDLKKRIYQLGMKQHPEILFRHIYDFTGSGSGKWHMGLEAYMRLLEYEEFQHAIKESKDARKQANTATGSPPGR